MAKLSAAHSSLLKLITNHGWGFVPTNYAKAHLLHMRRGLNTRLVKDAGWNWPEVKKAGIRASYSEKLSIFYCTTYRGFIKVEENLEADTKNSLLYKLFKKIFEENDIDFVKFRF